MKKIINHVRSMTFEQKTYYSARLSILLNLILGSFKVILSFFYGIFFLVSGIINLLIMLAKLENYLGIKHPTKKSFKYRNIFTGVVIIIAGAQYAIYMGRMLYTHIDLMKYDGVLAVGIATVSFVEMIVSIIGCFKVYGKGHFYRNLKVINLISSMTAIVLTEVALMSFASDFDTRIIDGVFGLSVGALISLLGVFILIAPKISIVDHMHNRYKINKQIDETYFEVKLTNNKIYSDYIYKAQIQNNIVDGYLVKSKSPIFKWNIYVKILIIVLSEILIFPYMFGAIINYFNNSSLIKKLDNYMMKLGYTKIKESEDELC